MTDFVDEGQFGSIHRRGHIAIALAHELSSYGNVLKPSQIQCRQDDCSRTLNLSMDSATEKRCNMPRTKRGTDPTSIGRALEVK